MTDAVSTGLMRVAGAGLVIAASTSGCGGIVAFDGKGGAGTASTTSTAHTSSTSGSTSTGIVGCAGVSEVACLTAYPMCVPIYDDTCCSTCNPGTCADCVSYTFHHCATKADACSTPKPACGITAPGECKGQSPTCPNAYCPANPGCVSACKPDGMGGCTPDCHALAKGACTATCAAPSPVCPGGYVPEAAAGCYTGYCIPSAICAM